MHQPYAETLAWEAVDKDYRAPLQAAGLNAGQANAVLNPGLYANPDDYRRAMVRRLQHELPSSAPRAARLDASPQMPKDLFAKHEQQVLAATYEAAHQSPTLRAVTTHDRTGRECTEFFGNKAGWMAPFKQPLQIAKRIGKTTY